MPFVLAKSYDLIAQARALTSGKAQYQKGVMIVSGVEEAIANMAFAGGIIVNSVGVSTRSMARAIYNESQKHVPYDTGDLFRSGDVVSEGFKAAMGRAFSPIAAMVGPSGSMEEYLPDSLSEKNIVDEAERIGFAGDELEGLMQHYVTYTAEHAILVHENAKGAVYHQGSELPAGAPFPEERKWSHFLAQAFKAMERRQGVLLRGVMQTALMRIGTKAAANKAAGFKPPTALRSGGVPRLVKKR